MRIFITTLIIVAVISVFGVIWNLADHPVKTKQDIFARLAEAHDLCALKGYARAHLLSKIEEGGVVCFEPMEAHEYFPPIRAPQHPGANE